MLLRRRQVRLCNVTMQYRDAKYILTLRLHDCYIFFKYRMYKYLHKGRSNENATCDRLACALYYMDITKGSKIFFSLLKRSLIDL